jgi:Methyltransferase domain
VKQLLQYAAPMPVESPDECAWYHTFELPDGRVTRATWDMRDCVDDCLGRLDFTGKTVLEIGPANGFFTIAMEQRGASVTCVENNPDQVWEYVPRVDHDVEAWVRRRRKELPTFYRTWWYTQKVFGCSAKIIYCGAAALNDALKGMKFDVCLIAGVLQHVKHPMDLIFAASTLADAVIFTEGWNVGLEASPHAYALFAPHPTNKMLDSWWWLSTKVVKNAMQMFGFGLEREARFNVRAWRMQHPDIAQDAFADVEHYNLVFTRTAARGLASR